MYVCVCVFVCVCVIVNKRDAENEMREIIVENKLCCRNVVLLIVDQIMLRTTDNCFLPKEEILRKIWIKFVNRKDL